uniref:Pyroglutamylated RFamide peptide n=1 Tax=Leptobrachium leishanense TaxID=445787 RepID=A0A8C5WDA0_9ANUR
AGMLCMWPADFALQESREQSDPWEKIRFWRSLLAGGALRDKKYTDPASLFSVAKELQGFGKEKAGFRFRFGRREDENQVEGLESQLEEKRSGSTLGSLSKELNGHDRKRDGFRFRLGRREDGNEVEDFESQLEEKRSGSPLGSLAEELNGYNRKKGGFSFRFGRR